MAKVIMLRHPASGIETKGFYGFSWTSFVFGVFPALFRQDFVTFAVGFAIVMAACAIALEVGVAAILLALGAITAAVGVILAMLVWGDLYNKYYTRRLIERGYTFVGAPAQVAAACAALEVSPPREKIITINHPTA